MGGVKPYDDERKEIMKKAIEYCYIDGFISYEDFVKDITGDVIYYNNISDVLQYYRKSGIVRNQELIFLNQMIANKSFIPSFEDITKILKYIEENEVVEVIEQVEVIEEDDLIPIYRKTENIETGQIRKKRTSKQERIQHIIDIEKNRLKILMEEKDISTLIEEAKQRIEEVKGYIKIVTDKLING